MPPRTAATLVATYLLYAAGLRSRTAVQLAGFSCYAGHSLEGLRTLMQELHDRHMRSQVSPVMRARVAEHRHRGDRLIIATASAFFFAEPLARELGIDDVVGTQVGFGPGGCTGALAGPIVEGAVKLEAARAAARAGGVELSDCSFYSDHSADLPLLEAVGYPYAVAPNAVLARAARARGWPVLGHDDPH